MSVQARSNLKLNAQLQQKDIELGAVLQLTAQLSEYGLPVEGRTQLSVELTSPNGQLSTEPMKEVAGGRFELEIKGHEYGVYRCRVIASGKTLRGSRFSRERTLTGSLYVLRPPLDPKPPVDGEPTKPCAKKIGVLVDVITRERRVAALLETVLAPRGVKLPELLACLKAASHLG